MTVTRRAAKRVSERTEEWLVSDGVWLAKRPDFDVPEVPDDIADLPDDSLMQLFVQLTEWLNYLSIKVTLATVDEHQEEASLKFDEARATVEYWGGSSSDKVTIAQAKRTTDPIVVQQRTASLEAYAHRKMLETVAGNVERLQTVVSREVTRRTGGVASSNANRARRWRGDT